MRFIAGLIFIVLSISSVVQSASQPRAVGEEAEALQEANWDDPKAFCKGRPSGHYGWRNAMEIVICPEGRIQKLAEGRFAPLLGRLPKKYRGELAFNVHKFCEGKNGFYCPPEGTDSLGMWQCPEGLQVACPWGQVCKQHGRHCMCVNPHKEPITDCKTRVVSDNKEKKVIEIICKGDPCTTSITSKCDAPPKTNVHCTKTKSCCTQETTSTTVTESGCSTRTVTTQPSCPSSSSSETCSWVGPTSCTCQSECSCSSTRTCRPTSTGCSCSNHKTIMETATIWKNETCRVTDHKCTTTKTLTASYVCLSHATHCLYDPRFEELAQQNLDWAVRPQCESVVVCDKWGWKGCDRDHVPYDAKVDFVVKSAFEVDAEDQFAEAKEGL